MWRRLGPWLTPTLLLVEIVLLCTGVVALRQAVVLVAVVAGLLALTVLTRMAAVLRRYRAERASGRDGWSAAEEGLAQLMPRAAARVVMYEVTIWACLVLAASRRRRNPEGGYHYGRSLRPLLLAVLCIGLVEASVVELVLALILGDNVWTWVALAAHLYALVWIAGLLASLSVRPHVVAAHGVRLRDAVFGELVIPYEAITGVRTDRRSNMGRSGLKVDTERRTAILAHGDTTVVMALEPDAELVRDGQPFRARFIELAVTADRPAEFCAALKARHAPAG